MRSYFHGYLDIQLLWIFLIPIHSMSAVITIQLNIVSEFNHNMCDNT